VGCLGAVAAPLAAQNDCTSVPAQARSLCNHAVDAFKTLQPLAGIAISGGNPGLGAARALGGLGHLFVSARVNVVKADVPNPDTMAKAISGTVPAPIIEAGVGLVRGFGGGLLALDALGSATLLPTSLDKLSVDSNATALGGMALGVGYGVRVGIVNGAFPIPAVSVSVMRRTLPRVRFGDLSSGDDFEFDTGLKATNIRIVAGMRLLLLDVAAGVGFDRYTSTARLRFYNNPPLNTTLQTISTTLSSSRQVLFADAGLNLAALKLVGEIGYQTGPDQQLSTTYRDFDPQAGHVYGGIGLRLGF
jgi:hypothetical protein